MVARLGGNQADLSSVVAELAALRRGIDGLRRDFERANAPRPGAYTVGAAAKHLGLSTRSVRRMLDSGAIAGVVVGSRRMVPRAEMERLTAPRPQPSPRGRAKVSAAPVAPHQQRADTRAALRKLLKGAQ